MNNNVAKNQISHADVMLENDFQINRQRKGKIKQPHWWTSMQSVNTYIIISIVGFQTCEISLIDLDVPGKKEEPSEDFINTINRGKTSIPTSILLAVVIC